MTAANAEDDHKAADEVPADDEGVPEMYVYVRHRKERVEGLLESLLALEIERMRQVGHLQGRTPIVGRSLGQGQDGDLCQDSGDRCRDQLLALVLASGAEGYAYKGRGDQRDCDDAPIRIVEEDESNQGERKPA